MKKDENTFQDLEEPAFGGAIQLVK